MLVWEPSSDADPAYFSIWSGPKQGWIDRAGRRIHFEPEQAPREPDRLTPFRRDQLFGYMRQLNMIVPSRFLEAGGFHEGRARVVLEGPCIPPDAGVCGAPMTLPSVIIRHTNTRLTMEKVPLTVPACQYTFINEAGDVVGPTKFEEVKDFHEGIAAVRMNELWGYVDRDLSVLVEPRFRSAGDLSGGLAVVRGSSASFYVDRTGQVAIPGPFDEAGEFHEGLAVVYRNGLASYIDKTGRQAVPGLYANSGRFFHGLGNVRRRDGRLAYIDRNGRVVYQWKER
jgi:hypothetical protein